ncbi:hypothetical protein ABK040_002640 [Willaertia magna]
MSTVSTSYTTSTTYPLDQPIDYLPIDSHGLIGNMQTCALVGIEGTIDWMCFPQFNSPSLFASILDCNKGGYFSIKASKYDKTKQHYWPDTNILITRFLSNEGIGEVYDFFPVTRTKETKKNWLIRRVQCVHGKLDFKLECFPGFNYARDEHKAEIDNNGSEVIFTTPSLSISLQASKPIFKQIVKENNVLGIKCEFTVDSEENEGITFIVRDYNDVIEERKCRNNAGPNNISSSDTANNNSNLFEVLAEELMHETLDYWHHWIGKCTYAGRWRENVHRSALMLKLLTFEKTGAILAAPTCSLPEGLGGVRNWDYRFCWIRDASFTIYSFMRIGFMEEAEGFVRFLEARIKEMSLKYNNLCHESGSPSPLQVMYSIDGEHELTEYTLDHLSGYMNSKPVRIGNGAYNQLQLDIYGELMDSIYIYNRHGQPISYDFWKYLRVITDWVCNNWDTKDEGIWEVRGGKQNFVYSRVMCWVCIDRALKIAEARSFPVTNYDYWIKTRNTIFEQIIENGYNKEMQSFTSFYGSDTLDASSLIIPLVNFLSPSDPMVLNTLHAINRPPEENGLVSSSLVYRYLAEKTDDGFAGGEEGTFSLCTYWLIEALVRATRYSKEDRDLLQEARMMFEQMLTYSNHVDLYSEEISFHGIALGNFPQAFTHISLISTAFNLDKTLNMLTD